MVLHAVDDDGTGDGMAGAADYRIPLANQRPALGKQGHGTQQQHSELGTTYKTSGVTVALVYSSTAAGITCYRLSLRRVSYLAWAVVCDLSSPLCPVQRVRRVVQVELHMTLIAAST